MLYNIEKYREIKGNIGEKREKKGKKGNKKGTKREINKNSDPITESIWRQRISVVKMFVKKFFPIFSIFLLCFFFKNPKNAINFSNF